MIYLQWFNQIRRMAELEHDLDNWELLGGWRGYFLSGLTPEEAYLKAKGSQ